MNCICSYLEKTPIVLNRDTSVKYFEIVQLLLNNCLNSKHFIIVLQTEQSTKKLPRHAVQEIITTKQLSKKVTVCCLISDQFYI